MAKLLTAKAAQELAEAHLERKQVNVARLLELFAAGIEASARDGLLKSTHYIGTDAYPHEVINAAARCLEAVGYNVFLTHGHQVPTIVEIEWRVKKP